MIDDDVELCGLLREYFQLEGFDFASARSGGEGLKLLAERAPGIVILDVMLPERDGFEILKEIRSGSDVPVIMLSARGEHIDRVIGLEIGADDYICKPFNARELSARVRAVLRRSEGPGTLRLADLEMCRASRSVKAGGNDVSLTNVEFRLLELLLSNAGKTVSLEQLSLDALGRRYSSLDRSLSVHLSRLRCKLGNYPDGSERIKTLRSEGFIYVYPESGSV